MASQAGDAPTVGAKGGIGTWGEVVPRECIKNALPAKDPVRGASRPWVLQHAWDVLREVLSVEQAMEGGAAVVQPLMEEEDGRWRTGGEGYSMPGRLATLQAPELEESRPMGPGFWHGGQGAQEAGLEPTTSEKAQGKAPAVEPPPPEMDEELAQWLQQEEVAVEVQWGQDAATLEVVREATGLLMQGQLEGLGGPS